MSIRIVDYRTGPFRELRETGRRLATRTGTDNIAAWLMTIAMSHNQYGQYA
jgi:hypothetical protein